MNRTITISIALLAVAAGATPTGCSRHVSSQADATSTGGIAKVLVNRDKGGFAIQGYDAIAYFTDGRPVAGDPRFAARHDGATYLFATAEHRDLFRTDPTKYAPAYGGYCGYAASINRLSPISPEYWQIADGRLILQHNQKAFELWNKDVGGNARKADANWPGLVERNGSTAKTLVNIDERGLALEGHDPVAYRTDGRPVQGSPEFMAVYSGATYYFASMDNRVTFESDPVRYAPSFGGYCGYAASINRISPVNPAIFQIIDDRLVLQHTDEAYRLFNEDAPKSLGRADKNWPGLVQRRGK